MKSEHEEIEAVFLEVDKKDIENKLLQLGAEKVGDIFYRHTAFDFPDYRLDSNNSWVRLRDNGEQVKLAFKRRIGVSSQDGGSNDESMEEIETVVEGYEDTKRILKKIGLIEKHEGEKKRTRWKKGEVEFDIDTWPEIPTLLEIEAPTWDEVFEAAKALGLNPDDKKICSANQIYRIYGFDLNDYQKISFDGMIKK